MIEPTAAPARTPSLRLDSHANVVPAPLIVSFVGAVALLVVVGLLSAWSIRNVYETSADVTHTHAVHASLEQLLATLVDAETGQRGFIITGEARYLEPYEAGKDRIKNQIDALRELTADNPEQAADLAVLATASQAKLDELQETIALRRDAGFDAAQQRVQTDAGKRMMDEMRALVTRIGAREDQLLAARTTRARRSYGAALATGLGSTTAAIAAVIFLFVSVRRAAVQRQQLLLTVAAEREYLEVTLMGIGDGVIVIDHTGLVTLMNPIAEGLTGRRQQDVLGHRVQEVFTIVNEQTRAVVANPAVRALDTGIVQELANHTILIAADGTERTIDDSGAPIRNPKGELVGAVLVFRDVTEQRRSAIALERAFQETQNAMRVKDEFLAVVSHELRTPINALVGWASMLQTGVLAGDRATSAIASIDRNAQSLAKMIEDLLDMSRLFSGRMRVSVSEIDLRPIALDAIDGVRLSADNKSIALNADLQPDVPFILGDGDRLKQVIWNLLANAIKFTPARGRIDLTLRSIDSTVRLEVRDTGIGIAPDFLPHVFERFRQADSSNARPGLGLGLAIARHLVELHGGTIHAESGGLGHGATFVVTLPAIAI